MTWLLRRLVGVMALALCANAAAQSTTIDFEGFADATVLTSQIPGLTFANAMVLTAGISLNELEAPPLSGVNVLYGDGGPLMIDFSTPITSLLVYVTYAEPFTIQIYDAASNVVGSATSLFASNLALSGDPGSSPNEAFLLAFAGGFTSAVFSSGGAFSQSFVLDDLTFVSATNRIPEPSTLALALFAFAVLLPRCRRARR